MTLCAFAASIPTMENPEAIAAAVNHETNELRISVPIGAQVRTRSQLIASETAPPSLSTLPLRLSSAAASLRGYSPLSITN
jgi:hypothetical protein